MKVAILNNLFPPNSHGGAEEAAKNQADNFIIQGNEVIVLTLSPMNKFSVRFCHCEEPATKQSRSYGDEIATPSEGLAMTEKKIKIYELRHRSIFNYFNIGKHSAPLRFLWHIVDVFNFCLADDIKKILMEEKPDLVICHNMKGLSYLTPSIIHNSSFIIHLVMHDVQLYTPSGLIEYGKENIFEHTGIFTRVYRFFTRRLFKYAEKVFFPSKWLLDFYRKNGFFINQEKIYQPNEMGFNPTVILDAPSGVEGQYSGIQKNNLDSRLRGNDTRREGFLFVGQLEPHKGILFLLDVFSSLSSRAERSEAEGSHNFDEITGEISPRASLSRNDSLQLHIVGDGSLMPEIKKRAQLNPNIIIHGRVAREKLPEFYSRAKATIFPSLVYENAPMVIAESLACDTQVIASRLGGAPELIREGENGATFTPGDTNDLVEKIKKYI